ncbi:PBP1A family penicillin-binding protein [Pontibacillus salicampi]|uniref:PBP1A family penicillin-binding protein n=1 Tax=Pontibacillus salicampi TaxID=1449801 RepID=A0ABV6LL99_9BACI
MADESQSRAARRKQQKSSKKQKNTSVMRRILMTIFIIGIIGAIGAGGVFAYYVSGAPALKEAKLSDPLSAKIYDMDDNLFADLGSEKRTKIAYEDVPALLEDAVIATEDARFRDHMGIDFQRIMAALWANVTQGFGAQGASTITQQVVKNAFLSPEKSLERKVQEQWLALRLEQQYSKDQILTMYLNKIYYGNGAYGVAKAAEVYFNKDLKDLTLAEAALLAGLPQRPSGYDPFEHPDLAQERKNTVLDLMVQHEKISEEEAKEARQVSVESMLEKADRDSDIPYDAFLEQVIDEVQEKMDGADIYKDGLKVYTTLDPNAQQKVESLLGSESSINFPDDQFQTGLTVLDTQSGAIRAIGGGRNKENISDSFNYAIQGDGFQPGSTFKPVTAYGPAIENMQWSTYHQLDDEPYNYQTDPNNQEVTNFDNNYLGQMSIREALVRSRNVPAVKTINEVGIGNAQSFAEGLGIDFEQKTMVESNAIGGGEYVTPLELAGAYSAFGNGGVFNEPYAVRKVEFQGDKAPVEFKAKSNAAMNEYTAYMITDMLKGVVSSNIGTGRAANVSGLPLAGKTGTTNKDDGRTTDSWFTGYTTNYTISVWSGYSGVEGADITTQQAKQIPQVIFSQVMGHISQGKNTADFQKPSSVVEVSIEEGTTPAKLPSEYTPSSKIITELFVKGTEPSKTSQAFDKLDPVQNLSSEYDEEKGALTLSWDYKEGEKVVFTVNGGIQGQEKQTLLPNTKDKKVQITDLKPGNTYTFDVIAISENSSENRSDPASVQVNIPEEENPDDILDGVGEDEEGNDEENQEDGDQEDNPSEDESDGDNGEENNGNGSNDNGQSGNGNDGGQNQGNGDSDQESGDSNSDGDSNQQPPSDNGNNQGGNGSDNESENEQEDEAA